MKNLFQFITIYALFLFSCSGNGPDQGKVGEVPELPGPSYQNPVMDVDFPDPTVIQGHDDWYYVYGTQTILEGKPLNIQVARSSDMVNWEHVGDALPDKPVWAIETQSFWAPDVFYDQKKNKYFMYYSGQSDDKSFDKCLAVATSDSPTGPFVDKGEPLLCGESFVNIDPMAFDDPKTGKRLLYWGSAFLPIKVQELTEDRLSFKPGTEPVDLVHTQKDKDYNILIEGAWVSYRNGKYYLYYSGDNCCGENANYAVMVARADHAMGPFERFGEANGTGSSVILGQKDHWRAPGHNSVVQDAEGDDWIFYHAIHPEKPFLDEQIGGDRKDRRIMLMDRITYIDGWPRVKGDAPSVEEKPTPITHLSNEQIPQ